MLNCNHKIKFAHLGQEKGVLNMKTWYIMNYKNGNKAIIEKSEYEREMKEEYGIENLENDYDECIVGVVESETEPTWNDLVFDRETGEYHLKGDMK